MVKNVTAYQRLPSLIVRLILVVCLVLISGVTAVGTVYAQSSPDGNQVDDQGNPGDHGHGGHKRHRWATFSMN